MRIRPKIRQPHVSEASHQKHESTRFGAKEDKFEVMVGETVSFEDLTPFVETQAYVMRKDPERLAKAEDWAEKILNVGTVSFEGKPSLDQKPQASVDMFVRFNTQGKQNHLFEKETSSSLAVRKIALRLRQVCGDGFLQHFHAGLEPKTGFVGRNATVACAYISPDGKSICDPDDLPRSPLVAVSYHYPSTIIDRGEHPAIFQMILPRDVGEKCIQELQDNPALINDILSVLISWAPKVREGLGPYPVPGTRAERVRVVGVFPKGNDDKPETSQLERVVSPANNRTERGLEQLAMKFTELPRKIASQTYREHSMRTNREPLYLKVSPEQAQWAEQWFDHLFSEGALVVINGKKLDRNQMVAGDYSILASNIKKEAYQWKLLSDPVIDLALRMTDVHSGCDMMSVSPEMKALFPAPCELEDTFLTGVAHAYFMDVDPSHLSPLTPNETGARKKALIFRFPVTATNRNAEPLPQRLVMVMPDALGKDLEAAVAQAPWLLHVLTEKIQSAYGVLDRGYSAPEMSGYKTVVWNVLFRHRR